MDYKQLFEQPFPVIDKTEKKIYIETANDCRGKFIIKNRGQGEIKGRVVSDSPKMSFEPEYFNGNNSVIEFQIDISKFKPGDEFFGQCIVISNGGEHLIDFHVKIVPYSLETKEDIRLTDLKDFQKYYEEFPDSARTLFMSHEFTLWLAAMGYEYMDLYLKFVKDSDVNRALDNFLVFNSLKENTEIILDSDEINLSFKPDQKDIYRGKILLKATDNGYLEAFITTVNTAPWLRIDKEKTLSSDFINGYCEINYMVNPMFLEKKVNHGKIFIGKKVINIKAVKEAYLSVNANRQYFDFNDKGNLIFTNRSGGKLPVDITPKEPFIHFEGTRFIVGNHAEIPFEISISPIMLAQLNLKKQAVIETEIEIESILKTGDYKKTIPITIGNFL